MKVKLVGRRGVWDVTVGGHVVGQVSKAGVAYIAHALGKHIGIYRGEGAKDRATRAVVNVTYPGWRY